MIKKHENLLICIFSVVVILLLYKIWHERRQYAYELENYLNETNAVSSLDGKIIKDLCFIESSVLDCQTNNYFFIVFVKDTTCSPCLMKSIKDLMIKISGISQKELNFHEIYFIYTTRLSETFLKTVAKDFSGKESNAIFVESENDKLKASSYLFLLDKNMIILSSIDLLKRSEVYTEYFVNKTANYISSISNEQ